MPQPADLTAPFEGYPHTVNKSDVDRVQILVKANGSGELRLPVRGKVSLKDARSGVRPMYDAVYVLNVPGSALSVIATLIAARKGFTVNKDTDAFIGSFMYLSVK